MELLERHVRNGSGERLPEARKEVVPEGPPAPDLVLPEARLRLVNAIRARHSERRAEVLRRQVLLVKRVAGFMEDAEERFTEVARIVPRRDAAIAGAEARAERMRGGVETSGGEVETERGRRRFREELLPLNRVVAFEDGAIGLARTVGDCAD